jgi:death-on-curing protein
VTEEPVFIALEDALFFHQEEIKRAGGISGIRDQAALEAALGAPKASFGGAYLMDVFEMAATYVESVCANHPFLDGNKRAGTACALTFLYLNGYEVDEHHDEELADMILDLVCHRINKKAVSDYFRKQSRCIK